MSHAFVAMSAVALTYYVLGDKSDDYRLGALLFSIAAGVASIICAVNKL